MTESHSNREPTSTRRQFTKKAAFAVPVLTMLGALPMNPSMSLGTYGEPLRKEPEPAAKHARRMSDADFRRR